MRFLLLILLSICNTIGYSQSKDFIETKNATKALKTAQKYANEERFKLAFKQLKEVIRLKKNFAVAHRELGKVALELEDFETSINAFETSFELNPNLSRSAYFECGEAYFKYGTFEKALEYYEEYKMLADEKFANAKKESGLEKLYNEQIDRRIQNCEYARNAILKPASYPPTSLGKDINSKADEYLPSLDYKSDALIFTRNTIKQINENILISKREANLWGKGKNFSETLNTPLNEGMAKYTTNGEKLYFAACLREDSKGGCDIYKTTITATGCADIAPLEGNINSEKWDSQPSLTCDGQSIYFSSTREGGFGGADIWVSHLQEDDTWGEPQNLGANINSTGDEEAPFIATDGTTLYYTSNGLLGLGDGDIFISKFNNKEWETPQNLGYPINTQFKEFGFFVESSGKYAYFASAHPKGEGGLDLYKVELSEKNRPSQSTLLEGIVIDAVSKTPIKTSVYIVREQKKIKVQSNEEGKFSICLPANKGYAFQVEAEGYKYYVNGIFLETPEPYGAVHYTLELEPKNIEKHIIHPPIKTTPKKLNDNRPKRIIYSAFFMFDSDNLTSESAKELRKIVHKLQRENDWKVEIIGYTDHIGNSKYNQQLSERRAQSVVSYLSRNNIRISKMRYEGRGSSITDKSDSDKARKQNRRVEVILKRE